MSTNGRLETLLMSAGLGSRMLQGTEDINLEQHLDYTQVFEMLEQSVFNDKKLMRNLVLFLGYYFDLTEDVLRASGIRFEKNSSSWKIRGGQKYAIPGGREVEGDWSQAAFFLALSYVLPFLTGQIPAVGSMLCPMHLPILLCGFLCGPWWAAAVGATAPLLRSALTSRKNSVLILPSTSSLMVSCSGSAEGSLERVLLSAPPQALQVRLAVPASAVVGSFTVTQSPQLWPSALTASV